MPGHRNLLQSTSKISVSRGFGIGTRCHLERVKVLEEIQLIFNFGSGFKSAMVVAHDMT